MAGLYQDSFVQELQAGLAGILGDWGVDAEAGTTLLTLSENATFVARRPEGARVVLRVHRPGYHSHAEILSELDWIGALRQDRVVETPAILRRRDGGVIGTFAHHGETRHVVAFDYMEGTEPDPQNDLSAGFRDLGAISARLHDHARRWPRSTGFVRKRWDWDAAFGPDALWGDWRAAPGLDDAGRRLLARLAQRLQKRCAAYGYAADRFGLIHGDLRLANLLVHNDRLGIIDFDDCGFSWFVYDLAAALSFIEARPAVPSLIAAWVSGYQSVTPLGEDHLAMIPSFLLFRRLLLCAWIASHGETETANWAGQGAYTAGTLEMAERYLAGDATLFAWR